MRMVRSSDRSPEYRRRRRFCPLVVLAVPGPVLWREVRVPRGDERHTEQEQRRCEGMLGAYNERYALRLALGLSLLAVPNFCCLESRFYDALGFLRGRTFCTFFFFDFGGANQQYRMVGVRRKSCLSQCGGTLLFLNFFVAGCLWMSAFPYQHSSSSIAVAADRTQHGRFQFFDRVAPFADRA